MSIIHTLPTNPLAALAKASAAVNSSLDPDAVLNTIASLAREVTHAVAANVFLLSECRKQMVVVAAVGQLHEAMRGRQFSADQGVPGLVLRTSRSIDLKNVRHCPDFDPAVDAACVDAPESMIAVPLLNRSEVTGVVQVVNRADGRSFTPDDMHILELFATLATVAVRNAQTYQELRAKFEVISKAVNPGMPRIIGDSAALMASLQLCDRVAPSTSTVLIHGETGTGKELVARYVHHRSRRSAATFMAINCAALPETLLESELFGHEKGAFTGAQSRRAGWFESAIGGTLFLDEIGEISKSTQAKLLRVLQEREVIRVGGTTPVACDVRVIAATNRDLKKMTSDGAYREDLYYRLSVLPIVVPPLRERREDLPALVEHFAARMCRDAGLERLRVSDEAMAALRAHRWPGNIRELQNVVERAVLMSEGGVLTLESLPQDIAHAAAAVDGAAADERDFNSGSLDSVERGRILHALDENQWNITQAAKALGVTRDKLRSRIDKHGIRKPTQLEPMAGGHSVSNASDTAK